MAPTSLLGSRGADICAGLAAALLTPILAGMAATIHPIVGLMVLIGLIILAILTRFRNPAAASFFRAYIVLEVLIVVGIPILIIGACGHIA